MENKINIAELLKDCPEGMELDCILFSNPVKYGGLDNDDCSITIYTETGTCFYLTKEGYLYNAPNSKCIIFPKGKTTWEGFVPPCTFKDGDIVISNHGHIHIYRHNLSSYCCLRRNRFDETITTFVKFDRLATEEEKQKLFDAIKSNGYKWNAETKTLEKLPKFKVGDRIKEKQSGLCGEILNVYKNKYNVKVGDKGLYLYFSVQDEWELVPNKFDITTLKPFESRVLVRDESCYVWEADIFGRCSDGYITLGGGKWKQCIPYEGNEHLFGTTNDCDEFYKTWI